MTHSVKKYHLAIVAVVYLAGLTSLVGNIYIMYAPRPSTEIKLTGSFEYLDGSEIKVCLVDGSNRVIEKNKEVVYLEKITGPRNACDKFFLSRDRFKKLKSMRAAQKRHSQ